MPKQKHYKPHRKVWVGAVSALLTLAAAVFSGFNLSPEVTSSVATGVGALLAYLVPAAEADFQKVE